MMQNGFDWMKYSLARINLVASNRGNCGNILPEVDDETIKRFRDALSGRLSEDDNLMLEVYDSLPSYRDETFGEALYGYYKTRSHSPIEPSGTFPVRYIMLHDAHHVLLDANTDEQGELNVLAFECGLTNGGRSASSIIPLLAQSKLFQESDLKQIGQFWEVGCKSSQGLLDTWDLRPDLSLSVAEVREKYNITVS